MKKHHYLALFLSFLFFQNAIAQIENDPCTAIILPAFTCQDSIIGKNAPADGFSPNIHIPCGGGTTEDNPTWYTFIAVTNSLTFNIATKNCSNNGGIQVTVWSGSDCNNITSIDCINCKSTDALKISTISGVKYWLQVDGCGETVCDYVLYYNFYPKVVVTPDTVYCGAASVKLQASGGGTYLWSNAATSSSINVNVKTTTTYSVSVSNMMCTTVKKVKIGIANPNPPLSILAPKTLCSGKATLVADSTFKTYKWSSGQTKNTITVTQSGNYTVSATDIYGCKATASTNILVPPLPIINGQKSICPKSKNTLSVAQKYEKYAWSDGQFGKTIDVEKAGIYTVTVTDSLGCVLVNNSTVSELSAPKFTINGTFGVCPNGNTLLEAEANNATFLWSNATKSNTLKVSNAGIYSVTVTDLTTTCQSDTSINVVEYAAPKPKIQGITDFCPNEFTVLYVDKYEKYLWNNSVKDSLLKVNQAGFYTISVTDEKGCVGASTINVTEKKPIIPIIDGKKILCNGEETTLETGIFSSYLWSDGSILNSIKVSKSGTYKVSVVDFNSCKSENTFEVTTKNIAQPVILGDSIFCEGNTKKLTLNNIYPNYNWSNNEKNSSISISQSGVYKITVSDIYCSASDSILITVTQNKLNANILGDTVICMGKNTVLSAKDLSADFYTWKNTNGVTFSGKDKYSITVSDAAVWSLTISDIYGCSAASSVKIKVTPNPVAKIIGNDFIHTFSTTILDAGNGFATYNWNTGEQMQIITISQSGIYTVTVTNNIGCSGVAEKKVNPKPDIFGNDKICKNEKAKLEIKGVFDTYLWSNGAITSSIETDKGGFYYVTVSKGNLFGKDTFEVKASNISADLKILDYNGFGVSCDGKNDGKISLENLKGEIAPVSILWSNGTTNLSINNLKSGIYEVKMKDAFGCEWIKSAIITAPKKFDFALTSTPPNCKAENSGEIILTKTENAFFPLKINVNGQIKNAQNVPFSLKNISSGDYKIEISDANNCEATQNIKVEKPIIPTVDLGEDVEIFAGDEVQLDAKININPTQIIWTKINDLSCVICLNPIVKPSTSGDYEIIVKDIFGCQASDRIKISINKDLFIPTAFSPNGDNQNDVFTILGNKSIKEIESFEIQDRWGNIVYQGGGTTANWDGTFRGTAAQIGVYIYLATIVFKNNTKRKVSGDVMLIR